MADPMTVTCAPFADAKTRGARRVLSVSAIASENVAITCGWLKAADSPWAIRAAISTPMFGAMPQSNEEIVNPTMPATNRRCRPIASPRRPPTTSISAYAVP